MPATIRTAVGTVRDVLAAAGVTVDRLAVRPSFTGPGAVALSLPYDLGAQVDALDALAAAGWDATQVSGTLYRVTRAEQPAESAPLVVASSHTDAECPSPTCTESHVVSELCEHGRAMDAPCSPCAVAGHEPVDVDELPEPRTDDARHLADCRGCALLAADGHAYASLIDEPLTIEELRALAVHPDADAMRRRVVAAALAEEEAELAARRHPGEDLGATVAATVAAVNAPTAADYAAAARVIERDHLRRPLPRS